ncbi:uncharacterized protein [Linepithema humile]|uniref:uncharacterized protein n=1 Tax=Linepithema humile TaxID=83485 RepID=UPI00351E2530
MVTVAEDRETVVQKGLSEWWSEETEYVFQRIERWAAFARGYYRLRSQRWSKNQQATQESSGETACTPQFYSLKRSRRKSGPEETKINCCGTFNYQSNSKLDSNCLETYRYDHSIYFKTIGDIRSDKRDFRDQDEEKVSISSEELVEWDVSSLTDLITDKLVSKETCNNNRLNNLNIADTVIVEQEENRMTQNAWPIVDLSKLDLNLTNSRARDERLSHLVDQDNYGKDERQLENNNIDSLKMDKIDNENQEDESKGHERMKRFRSVRKTKRSSRNVRRPPIVGENNVVWPGILLNYTNNFDVAGNPHE